MSGEASGGNAFGLESNVSFRCITGYDSRYPEVLDVCDTILSSSQEPSVGLDLVLIRSRWGSDTAGGVGGASGSEGCWVKVDGGDKV